MEPPHDQQSCFKGDWSQMKRTFEFELGEAAKSREPAIYIAVRDDRSCPRFQCLSSGYVAYYTNSGFGGTHCEL